MEYIRRYRLFFGSLFLGVLLWILLFVTLPLEPTEPFKIETLLLILASYISIVLGFLSFKFNQVKTKIENTSIEKVLKILLIIIIASFVLRWIDLFLYRDLSFSNEFKINRRINDKNYSKSNIVLIIASILKSLYFFPVVIVIASKFKKKHCLSIVSYIVLFLPLVESLLKGTRKPFLEILILVLFTLIIYQNKTLKRGNILKLVGVGFAFVTISLVILIEREKKVDSSNIQFYNMMLEGRYNDMLKPRSFVTNFFNDESKPEIFKLYALIFLQTGQYVTHGVFEFNHIMNKKNLSKTNGSYTFVTIPKFINKTGLFNRISYSNPSPRKKVYLTTFGGLYIDFRWATLIVMFLFGVLQKYVYQKSKKSFIYAPILIYFLIINVFLLMINYIRGAGIYPILSFFVLLLILKFIGSNLHEKSIST